MKKRAIKLLTLRKWSEKWLQFLCSRWYLSPLNSLPISFTICLTSSRVKSVWPIRRDFLILDENCFSERKRKKINNNINNLFIYWTIKVFNLLEFECFLAQCNYIFRFNFKYSGKIKRMSAIGIFYLDNI